ncbi:MAG: hypothetical protein AAGE52_39965 [Myxococcota bacterium]
MTRAHLNTFAALSLTAIFLLPTAKAQDPVRAEVFTVLAKEDAGSIDPSLAEMGALRRPPFNAFRSMEIIERDQIRLRVRTPEEIILPNGRRMRIRLQSVMPDGRFRVRVSIKREEGNNYLPLLQVVASPGDPFFVAGQAHDGGTLVIGIRLGEAAN